jgi:molybdopterin molybdotransferase
VISLDEALKLTQLHRWQGKTEKASIIQCHSRVTARAYTTSFPFPLFDNSAMDGYAVGSPGGPWRLDGELQAGIVTACSLGEGQAIRIFTGAAVPQGTFAVLPQEDATVEDGVLSGVVRKDQHIRFAGEEFSEGTTIIEAGVRITPPVIAAFAAMGVESIEVVKAPRVAIITTGNEVVEPGHDLEFGQIYNSNRYAVEAVLTRWGIASDQTHVSDNKEAFAQLASELSASHDLIITTGGVSVGNYDYAPEVFSNLGFGTIFHGVAMKPGKPIALAQSSAGKTWIGLPGNPLSCWVGMLVFVATFLGFAPRFQVGSLGKGLNRKTGRDEFYPYLLESDRSIVLLPRIGSHANFGLLGADGLALVQGNIDTLEVGDDIKHFAFDWSTK